MKGKAKMQQEALLEGWSCQKQGRQCLEEHLEELLFATPLKAHASGA